MRIVCSVVEVGDTPHPDIDLDPNLTNACTARSSAYATAAKEKASYAPSGLISFSVGYVVK